MLHQIRYLKHSTSSAGGAPWKQPGWRSDREAWMGCPLVGWGFQLATLQRAVIIGQVTGFEIKHLLADVQFGASCISLLSFFCIFKEPGLCVSASPPGFHPGGPAQPGAGEDMRQIYSSWRPEQKNSSDLEARWYISNRQAPKVIPMAQVSQTIFLGLPVYVQVRVVSSGGQITETSIHIEQ